MDNKRLGLKKHESFEHALLKGSNAYKSISYQINGFGAMGMRSLEVL